MAGSSNFSGKNLGVYYTTRYIPFKTDSTLGHSTVDLSLEHSKPTHLGEVARSQLESTARKAGNTIEARYQALKSDAKIDAHALSRWLEHLKPTPRSVIQNRFLAVSSQASSRRTDRTHRRSSFRNPNPCRSSATHPQGNSLLGNLPHSSSSSTPAILGSSVARPLSIQHVVEERGKAKPLVRFQRFVYESPTGNSAEACISLFFRTEAGGPGTARSLRRSAISLRLQGQTRQDQSRQL